VSYTDQQGGYGSADPYAERSSYGVPDPRMAPQDPRVAKYEQPRQQPSFPGATSTDYNRAPEAYDHAPQHTSSQYASSQYPDQTSAQYAKPRTAFEDPRFQQHTQQQHQPPQQQPQQYMGGARVPGGSSGLMPAPYSQQGAEYRRYE
jgi:hypothetical protein